MRTIIHRIMLVAIMLACTTAAANDRLSVAVSIAPQQYFLQQIAGDRLDVLVMLDHGGDPHTYEPTPRQLTALSDVSVFFSAGLSVENSWKHGILEQFENMEWIEPEIQHPDEHFWLSPTAVIQYVEKLQQVLSATDPEYKAVYKSGAEAFTQQVKALDVELKQLFGESLERKTFLVGHEAWSQFAQDYGLKQLVIEKEGKSLTPKHLVFIIQRAKILKITKVFADHEHGSKSAQQVAETLNAELIMLNPVSENWQSDLKAAAHFIHQALK